MTHIIFSFFLFLCALSFGQSEKAFHKVFTEQDGLEIDVIKAMTFDDDGFLWIGGKILDIRTIVLSDKQQCLQRFNGSSFHTIYFPPKLGRVIDVEQIYKRFDGKFYLKLGTQEGAVLTLFDPYDLSFAKIQLPKTPSFNPITSNVFYYNNQEYILTQIDRFITVNILEKDLSLVPLFTFTHDENKFRLDPTSVFIPKQEYCLIGDDNFPVSIFDWDGTLIHKYSSASFITERDSHGQKFWIEDVFVKDSIEFVFFSLFTESDVEKVPCVCVAKCLVLRV
ncbi:MAG: hypothetical protein K0U54_00150 [Bacteroidetes bacterium]|nr:hypothetical protein [Bacteroidota bacterium]